MPCLISANIHDLACVYSLLSPIVGMFCMEVITSQFTLLLMHKIMKQTKHKMKRNDDDMLFTHRQSTALFTTLFLHFFCVDLSAVYTGCLFIFQSRVFFICLTTGKLGKRIQGTNGMVNGN